MDRSHHLHIDQQYAAYIGNFGVAEKHRHGAMALLISLSGKIKVSSHLGEAYCQSALIDAHVAHSVDCGDEYVATLYLEPDSILCSHFRFQYMQQEKIAFDILSSNPVTDRTRDIILSADVERLTGLEIGYNTQTLDQRIQRSIETIRSGVTPEIGRAGHAYRSDLSPSRFSKLFHDQAFVSFQRYKLWNQIIRFACAAQNTKSLTSSALEAGFYDAAHMNNTFRNFIGFNPGRVLNKLDHFTINR